MADEQSSKPGSDSELAQWLNRAKKKPAQPNFAPKPAEAPSVLSHGQERLWMLEQLYPGSGLYNYAQHYHMAGSVQPDLLIESFQRMAARHEVLRSNYRLENGTFIQEVRHDALPVEHLQAENLPKTMLALGQQAFDLETDPLFKLYVFEGDNQRLDLLVVLHHIVGDAWSQGIIDAEVGQIYRALVGGTEPTIKELPIQYTDAVHWQRQQPTRQADLQYWLEKLGGELPTVALPKTQSNAQWFEGKTFRQHLSDRLSADLKSLAAQLNTTMFALVLTAYKLLLSRYAGHRDIVVGTPVANRDKPELEQLVGFFNETIVLRSQIDGNQSFEQLCNLVAASVREGLEHKNVPFEELVNRLQPSRQAGENPLFQTMFLYNAPPAPLDLGPEVHVQETMLDLGVSKFDLTLFAIEANEHLQLDWEHALHISTATIASMASAFETLLNSIVAAPDAPVCQLQYLPQGTLQQVLFDWNQTSAPEPEARCIHQLIEQQATANPDAVAVVCQGQTLSYAALNQWANQLAAQLVPHISTDQPFVGLYTSRSIEMVVGILAILKAGGAYLPLDPNYPAVRLQFMLQDARASVLLTEPEKEPDWKHTATCVAIKLADRTAEVTVVQPVSRSNTAYIIYTSGSTGQPKGVAVSHGNLLYSTCARQHFYNKQPESFLLLSSFSFDSSIVGLFWSLCSGAKLVLPAERMEQDVAQLAALIEQERVTHTLMLPSLYGLLLELSQPSQLQSLQTVMVAGEACPSGLPHQHFGIVPGCRLYNEYGPTEATVWCIAHEITASDAHEVVPIGKPIPYYSAYILDADLNPAPIGVAGNLFIGGPGVTAGYLNRAELTAERFIVHANPSIGRLYNTGDLARYREDGTIDFIGRADHQVKIRGHRVELPEIELRLCQHEAVAEAVVQVLEVGQTNKLLAWVQTAQSDIELQLQQRLAAELPEYMVPERIVALPQFPRLPNGKIDRVNLPLPETTASGTAGFVSPANDLELQLADIWKAVLELNSVGATDNFFDIGGDSLQSIRVVAHMRKEGLFDAFEQASGKKVVPTVLITNPTIRQLAQFLEQPASPTWTSIVPMQTSGTQPPLFCLHSGGAHVLFYQALASQIDADRPVYAIQPTGLDGDEAHHESIAEMAGHYIEEMRKVQPSGPYHLLGTCFGNAVGIEMAHQLKELGEDLAVLYVVDSAPAYLEPPSPNGERKPVSRALKMVQKGDWHGIKRKFENKLIRYQKKRTAHQRNAQQVDLDEIIDSLNQLYVQYTWRPVQSPIVLIRSTEFSARKNKQFHLDNWHALAKSGLQIAEVNGHHLTLFKEPEVDGLARFVNEHLQTLISTSAT